MKKHLAYLLAALLLTAAACSENADKKAETPAAKPVDAATLQREYAVLRDTLDGRWAQMMASDDEKIFYQKRLLEEISYIPGEGGPIVLHYHTPARKSMPIQGRGFSHVHGLHAAPTLAPSHSPTLVFSFE